MRAPTSVTPPATEPTIMRTVLPRNETSCPCESDGARQRHAHAISAAASWIRRVGQIPPTRGDIVAATAAGAGALLTRKLAWAEAPRSPGRIDLHHHYFPPAFLDAQRHAAVRQNEGEDARSDGPLWHRGWDSFAFDP